MSKVIVAISLLFSMMFSVIGFAELSHYCEMQDISINGDVCDTEKSCCDDLPNEDSGCCSTELAFYQAEFSPVVCEINTYIINLSSLEIISYNIERYSKPLYKDFFESDHLFPGEPPDFTSLNCTFLI